MQITITLSYTARMLVSATGSTPPTAYRIDLHDAAPAYVADHAEEHDITEVTVTAADIQAHGTVTAAAVAILTDAAPEPEPVPYAHEHDLPRAYADLINAVARDVSLYAPGYMKRAQALACNAIGRRARAADVYRIARNNGATPEHAEIYVRHATSAGRHAAAEHAYRADAARRAADRGMNPNASQPTSAERRAQNV